MVHKENIHEMVPEVVHEMVPEVVHEMVPEVCMVVLVIAIPVDIFSLFKAYIIQSVRKIYVNKFISFIQVN